MDEALTVGALAREMLSHSGFCARVMSSGSKAVYVEDDAGRILWFSPPGSVLHRRCIVVAHVAERLREGDIVRSDGAGLRSDEGYEIRWVGAATWRPPAPGTLHLPLEAAAAALERVLLLTGSPHGLAKPTLAILSGAERWSGVEQRLLQDWVQAASRHIARVVDALAARDGAGVLAASRPLVGLGEGLTPSGDDFIGGMLFGLRQLGRGSREDAWIDWLAVERWLAGAASQTNKISYTILSDLALGHGPEALHALAEKVLAGGTSTGAAWHAARVTRMGHTSGWDMLAGFSAALCGCRRREGRGGESAPKLSRGLAKSAGLDRRAIPAGGIHGN